MVAVVTACEVMAAAIALASAAFEMAMSAVSASAKASMIAGTTAVVRMGGATTHTGEIVCGRHRAKLCQPSDSYHRLHPARLRHQNRLPTSQW